MTSDHMASAPAALSRSRLLFGQAVLDRFAAAHILVCGLGAVGSFAVETLARNGVGRFTLIDSDTIEPSNINRQLYATYDTIGRTKTEEARARILAINPQAHVTLYTGFLTPDNCAEWISTAAPDCVVDAIDTVPSKTALLAYCVRQSIPVFSSMGAARKTDPLQIKVGDISKTNTCPLAKAIRNNLAQLGIKHGILCAYSTEPAIPMQIPTEPCEGRPPMGSTLCVTAPMGIILATQVLTTLRTR